MLVLHVGVEPFGNVGGGSKDRCILHAFRVGLRGWDGCKLEERIGIGLPGIHPRPVDGLADCATFRA